MERIKKNPPEENYLGISKDELAGMAADERHEFEEYRSAVLDDIKDPTSVYAGKSTEEIVAMLRKEADGIGVFVAVGLGVGVGVDVDVGVVVGLAV